jgi:tetratricopeptide (TPR) repeat protein
LALGAALALALAPLAPRLALAAPNKEDVTRAEAKAMEAKFAFKAEKYADAARLFLEAYAIVRRPALLFNAARAWEEAKRYREAKVAFEQYLELPDVSADGKADARRRVAALEGLIAAEARAQTPSPPPPTPTPPPTPRPSPSPSPTPPPPSPAPAATTASAQIATPPAPAGPARWLSWTLLGGGGLLALLGAASLGNAKQMAEDANAMDFGADDAKSDYNARFDQAESVQTGGIVLLAVGAGLAGWGAWRLWGPSGRPAPQAAALDVWAAPAPWLAGQPASGLALGGRF